MEYFLRTLPSTNSSQPQPQKDKTRQEQPNPDPLPTKILLLIYFYALTISPMESRLSSADHPSQLLCHYVPKNLHFSDIPPRSTSMASPPPRCSCLGAETPLPVILKPGSTISTFFRKTSRWHPSSFCLFFSRRLTRSQMILRSSSW
jgi:hypothetical protein